MRSNHHKTPLAATGTCTRPTSKMAPRLQKPPRRRPLTNKQITTALLFLLSLFLFHQFQAAPVAQANSPLPLLPSNHHMPLPPAAAAAAAAAAASASANLTDLVRQTNDLHHQQPQTLAVAAGPLDAKKLSDKYVRLSKAESNVTVRSAYGAFTNHKRGGGGDSRQSSTVDHGTRRSFNETICIGTSNRMSGMSNKTGHYQNLVDRYRNCTHVIGNLEITWLEKGADGRPLDLTFLESIREITGYLLIAYVDVERIRMPNLQIIRGRDLFRLTKNKEEFGMFLIENELKTLELPNLREIIAGSVGSYNNRNLCVKHVAWDELLNGPSYKTIFSYNGTEPECPPCDSSCANGCWGEGPDLCQKFSKTICSPQCSQGRCFGSAPRECCHLFCAGGCTGPMQTQCIACKNFSDDGECIQECPSMMRYNPTKFSWEANPNGKYAFGATCVKECPGHLLRDNGACVRTCPPNKRSQNGECVTCGGPCPKNCQGVEVVHSGNIDQLINCTVIEGSITILDTSFTGYSEVVNNTFGTKYEPLHPSRLSVFETVHEITGFLNIQASHPDFKNLSYFKNLKYIGGRQTTDYFYALSIIKTSLVSLDLRSLERIRSGRTIIIENKDLCFADTIDWSKTNITEKGDYIIRNNADKDRCRQQRQQCHEQCSADGCWGPGPDECLTCKNYKLEDYCVSNCDSTQHSVGLTSFNSGSRTCKRCHPECRGGCSGTEANQCRHCRSVRDGPHCVAECPSHKFFLNGVCEECDKSCVGGCTGPSNKLGPGGCNSCNKAIVNSTNSVHCIAAEQCPEGYYQEYVGYQAEGPLKLHSGKSVCRRCHQRCKSCIGMGTHTSVCECARYVAGEQCEDHCPRDYYADEQLRRCVRCSAECNGCFGPTESDCLTCRVYRIYADSYSPTSITSEQQSGNKLVAAAKQQLKFNCTAQCPPSKPYRISESNLLDPYCSEYPGPDSDNPHVVLLGSTSIMFMLIISAAIMFCIFVYRCKLEQDKTVKLTMRLSGFDDVEPLNQSNLKPNLAPLRSIKENELRKGNLLGSGFGGTVYQGVWQQDGQKERRVVAIKVLRDNGQPNMTKEFLDEAYVMASVNHPNLVRLLGICNTSTSLMLVTPLMVLGCLLDQVKKHKNDIGSKNLLEWSKQIAKGMAYLEERRLVHRDLALRNVLLQRCGRAMISDFGLAKFLDVDQSEYHSGGGRLPIKWLAPECIRERKFTHKSDVWAFGVTIWELMTFGMKPFENYDTKDVPLAIEKGARLHQPHYMSAEVYKVMYSCWFYNPEDRPNFKGLAENFVNFARDPERYLICGSKGIEYSAPKELGRNSDSDEMGSDEFGSSMNSLNEDDGQNRLVLPDLISCPNQNRISDMPAIELRHHSESETVQSQHLSTPTIKKVNMFHSSGQHLFDEEENFHEAMSLKAPSTLVACDSNNNNFSTTSRSNMNAESWTSVHHTVSTNSIGQKSEQPTDGDDYLLPSPCSNEGKFTKLFAGPSTKLPPSHPFPRDPPHSAGLIGITNEEYFRTRSIYVNPNGSHGAFPHSLV